MQQGLTIDLNERIERLGIGRLAVVVIGLCFMMMIADGYDFAAMSVATPAILKQWRISPKEMGFVFSITFFGLLVGSLIYGWLGDRFGRRFTIIFGTFNFGLPVLLTVWATNLQELAVLRFIGGIGMGGIVPIAYTVASEYAPRRLRSSVTVVTMTGYSIGAAITGVIASVAIPAYGWASLFVIGASASLVMAFVLIAALPESVLFLALRKPDSPQLRPLAERLLRGERLDPAARFIARDPQEQRTTPGRDSVLHLFHGPRAWATTLLWLLFVFDSLGFFFLASWLPVVMETAGVAPSTASLTQSLFVFAGLVGGLGIMRFLDRIGPIAVVVLPLLGGPFELAMGIPGLSHAWLLAAVAGAGVCLSGIHYAVYAIVVRFYPPSIRGRGVSSATVFGRAGGIVAPYIGGSLLAIHMPLQQLMIFAALPCLATAVIGVALGIIYLRHFDEPVEAAVAAGRAPARSV